MNPRKVAADIVQAVQNNGAYANIALAHALRKNRMDDRDRRFCTELAYGTIKAGKSIDWFLNRHIKKRTLDDSPEEIRSILRVGAYQLLFMTKIPHAAAVNESTELAKQANVHEGIVKFVNGVLRNCAREIESIAGTKSQLPAFGKIVDEKFSDHTSAEYIAVRYLHPQWLIEHWIDNYGVVETIKLCEFDNQDPPLSIRVNTLKTSRSVALKLLASEGISAKASDWAAEGIIVKDHGSLDDFYLMQDGTLVAQDESSQLVAYVLDPKTDDLILDACAAPGGKTTHIAALIQNRGRIAACDSNSKRLELLRKNAERLTATCIEPFVEDARKLGNLYADQFDRVLVDAPCSGLGVLRRKPDARWKKTPESLKNLPKLQMEILESCSKCVMKNGALVYSTCTIEKAENDDVIDEFLAKHPGFIIESAPLYTSRDLLAKNPSLMAFRTLKLFPTIDGVDGFFIARMKRVQ